MNHTLLIAFAIVFGIAAIIAVLKLIMNRQLAARKKALQDTYRRLVMHHDIAPEVMEEHRHRIYGLDTDGMAFVYAQDDEARPGEVINLHNVDVCKVSKTGHSITATTKRGQTSSDLYISAIVLVFQMRNGTRIDVPMYTEMLDGIEMRAEMQLVAERWEGYIDTAMQKQFVGTLRKVG